MSSESFMILGVLSIILGILLIAIAAELFYQQDLYKFIMLKKEKPEKERKKRPEKKRKEQHISVRADEDILLMDEEDDGKDGTASLEEDGGSGTADLEEEMDAVTEEEIHDEGGTSLLTKDTKPQSGTVAEENLWVKPAKGFYITKNTTITHTEKTITGGKR